MDRDAEGAATAADSKNSAMGSGAVRVPGPKSAKRSALTRAILAAGPIAKDPWSVERWRKRIRKRLQKRDPESEPDRLPGEDRDVSAKRPKPKPRNVNPWAQRAGRAFDLMPSEVSRMESVHARADQCRRGKGILVEHMPCGWRYMLKFGCRTRVCPDCAKKYQAAKRQRLEPITRLHQEQGDKSKLKFLTLTFPNVEWETPDACRTWFRERTVLLRRFLRSKTTPRSWGVKGYVAVWEVTAERECSRCHCARSAHDPKTGKGRRGNGCDGWKSGEKTGRFHPHLHILILSNFIPINAKVRPGLPAREYLQDAWAELTGGRQINIAPVDGPNAVRYLLKYLGKPWAGVPDDLQVVALYRIRRLVTTGCFYGRAFKQLSAEQMTPEEKQDWKLVCWKCGVREPMHPPPIDECGDAWKFKATFWSIDPDTGQKRWDVRSVTEWATVKVGVDLEDSDSMWLPAAWMGPIGWDGRLRADALEQTARTRVRTDQLEQVDLQGGDAQPEQPKEEPWPF